MITIIGLVVALNGVQESQMEFAGASMISLTFFLGNLFSRLPPSADSVPLLGIHYIANFLVSTTAIVPIVRR